MPILCCRSEPEGPLKVFPAQHNDHKDTQSTSVSASVAFCGYLQDDRNDKPIFAPLPHGRFLFHVIVKDFKASTPDWEATYGILGDDTSAKITRIKGRLYAIENKLLKVRAYQLFYCDQCQRRYEAIVYSA